MLSFARSLIALLLALCLSLATNALAGDKHQHSRMGSHGMVLLDVGGTFYASHLPLYYRPHDYQIIYQIDVPKHVAQGLQQLLAKGMVTLLPGNFDLDRLVSGEELVLFSQFYQGHFERGGTPWQSKVQVEFRDQVYLRQLEDTALAAPNGQYQLLHLHDGNSIAVHQIRQAPSFDHIISFSDGCIIDGQKRISLKLDKGFALELNNAELTRVMHGCSKVQNLYWEVADFK